MEVILRGENTLGPRIYKNSTLKGESLTLLLNFLVRHPMAPKNIMRRKLFLHGMVHISAGVDFYQSYVFTVNGFFLVFFV